MSIVFIIFSWVLMCQDCGASPRSAWKNSSRQGLGSTYPECFLAFLGTFSELSQHITAHHSTFGTFLILFLSLLRPVMAWTLWFPVVPYSSLRFLVAFRMPCLCAPTSLDPCHTFIPNKPWHSPELFPWRFQEKHLKCAKCMKVSWKHKNSACKAQTSKRETMDSTSLRYRMPSRSGEFQERWFGPIYGLVQHMPGKHKQANQIGRTILILLTSLS